MAPQVVGVAQERLEQMHLLEMAAMEEMEPQQLSQELQ
jgi:hypothetical protein